MSDKAKELSKLNNKKQSIERKQLKTLQLPFLQGLPQFCQLKHFLNTNFDFSIQTNLNFYIYVYQSACYNLVNAIIFSNKYMSFIARQNRRLAQDQPTNNNFGKGGIHTQMDQGQMNQKMSQQQLYKQQLQRQIMEKEQRKKKQLQKIRREDEKFMKQVQQINRQQRQQKQRQKAKQQKIFQNANNNQNSPPVTKKQVSNKQNNKTNRMGSLNIAVKQQKQVQSYNQLPKLGFDYARLQSQSPSNFTVERRRPYVYEDYQPANQYYEQRIRRHKEHMNQKLDQLFNHIHSTKDNIKADQEIEKIKRRLRNKQPSVNQIYGKESQVQLQYENKFYHVPKKMTNYNPQQSNAKSRMLDYQSTSKFTKYGTDSRAKIKTQHQDMYSLPEIGQVNDGQHDSKSKWGHKPEQGRFLGNREALDYQIAKTLQGIDQFQTYLKQKGD